MEKQEVAVQNEVAPESIEALKSVAELITDFAVVVKKVKADGKVDANDTVYILPFIQAVPKYLKLDYKGALEEIKKPSLSKILALASLVNEAVKKVKEVK